MSKPINEIENEVEYHMYLSGNLDSIENYRSMLFNKQCVEIAINLFRSVSSTIESNYNNYINNINQGENCSPSDYETIDLNGVNYSVEFILFKCFNDVINYSNIYFDNFTQGIYKSCRTSDKQDEGYLNFNNISNYIIGSKSEDIVNVIKGDAIYKLVHTICNIYKHDKIVDVNCFIDGAIYKMDFLTKDEYKNEDLNLINKKSVASIIDEIEEFMDKNHEKIQQDIIHCFNNRRFQYLYFKSNYKSSKVYSVNLSNINPNDLTEISFGKIHSNNKKSHVISYQFSYAKLNNPVVLVVDDEENPVGYLKAIDNSFCVCKKYSYVSGIDDYFEKNYKVGKKFL